MKIVLVSTIDLAILAIAAATTSKERNVPIEIPPKAAVKYLRASDSNGSKIADVMLIEVSSMYLTRFYYRHNFFLAQHSQLSTISNTYHRMRSLRLARQVFLATRTYLLPMTMLLRTGMATGPNTALPAPMTRTAQFLSLKTGKGPRSALFLGSVGVPGCVRGADGVLVTMAVRALLFLIRHQDFLQSSLTIKCLNCI